LGGYDSGCAVSDPPPYETDVTTSDCGCVKLDCPGALLPTPPPPFRPASEDSVLMSVGGWKLLALLTADGA